MGAIGIGPGLTKRFHNLFDIRLCDTNSSIRNRQIHAALAVTASPDVDAPALHIVFHGIGQQIQDNLFDQPIIGP